MRLAPLSLLLAFPPALGSPEECFCRYPVPAAGESFNDSSLPLRDAYLTAPEALEPVWVCVGGVRQYQCLLKGRRGRFAVQRGQALDRPAPSSFCTAARAHDACQAPAQAGYTVMGGELGAIGQLRLQVSCPNTINCTNASAFLQRGGRCEDGPLPNDTFEETIWMADEPAQILHSPVWHNEQQGSVRLPFAYIMDMDVNTILTYSPWAELVRTFERRQDGSHLWGDQPTSTYSYPSEPMWLKPIELFNRRPLAFSNEGFITQFEFNDAWDPSFSYAQQDAWNAQGQKALLFPRGSAWGAESPVELRGPVDKAGFGISADLSGGYAVVGTRHHDRAATTAGVACIFEFRSGAWQTQPEAVIGAGYEWMEGFGHMVAIDSGSPPDENGDAGPATVLIAAPGEQHVLVFERATAVSGTWSTTASADLTQDGAYYYPKAYAWPSALYLDGAFAVVAALDRAFVYTRRSGSWTDPPTELSGYSPAGTGFGQSLAVADLGGGRGLVVAGILREQRALLFERNPDTGAWVHRDLRPGAAFSLVPSGFGRDVGASKHAVAVGSDDKKVFLYTQLVRPAGALVDRSDAEPFEGSGPVHEVTFNTRHLRVGPQHTLCVDLGDFLGEFSDENHGFKDVGLRVRLTYAERDRVAEEL